MSVIPSTDSNGDGKPDLRGYLKAIVFVLGAIATGLGYLAANLPAEPPPVPAAAPPPASAPLPPPADTDAPAPAPVDAVAPVGGAS